jgi:hypothetical protein
MNDLKELLDREARRVDAKPEALETVLSLRDRKRRNKRIAAGVVGVAFFVAAVWIVTTGGPFDRTKTPVAPGGTETGPPVAPDPDAESSNALPPEGARPSTPESGELVLQLESSVWVYADGRLISRLYDQDALGPYSGLVEQHLTHEGVEFLRSNVLSTGLFDRDLNFVWNAFSVSIQVRDGDRLVLVHLGPAETGWRGLDSVEATPQQASVLNSLQMLLTDPTSWPSDVWEDQEIRGYVPTSYSVCSRGFPEVEPSRVLALLPEPARDLLGAGYMKTDGIDKSPVDCSQMTTDEARTLAGILDAAGLANWPGWLAYSLEDPEKPRGNIVIGFDPNLPHGVRSEVPPLPPEVG